MEMMKCSDTISQEIEKHSKSNPFVFYKNALIQCDNNGCNQKLSLSNWYKHIKFNCEYRILNCPAIECSVKKILMIFLLTLFNVLFTLFGVLDVKLTGLYWRLDTTEKKVKNASTSR